MANIMNGPSAHAGMGANLYAQAGVCSFRLWAPNAREVLLVGSFTNWEAGALPLASEQNGYWSADVSGVTAGDAYKFIIQNRGGSPFNNNWRVWRVDAYAKDVENSGEEANGFVVDPTFTFSSFRPPAFENYLVYELHVGSFAGFNDDIKVKNHTARFPEIQTKLGYIRELGFNAILLMPVGETRADIGLGYAPTNWFAPEDDYGNPQELRELVNAAHNIGLAVIFDVVFNHAATEDNRYWEYDGMHHDGGIYFENGGDTDFGRRPSHWKIEVRNFFLDNARMWFREYNADGLRFDAAHLIQDDSLRHIVRDGIRREFPDKYVMAEYFKTAPHPVRELGFQSAWDGSAPFAMRDAAGGNAPVDRVQSFLNWFGFDHPWNLVRYLLGSHDQIDDLHNGATQSNRYFVEFYGGRDNWFARAKARLAWALNVAIPCTPMLFMGSECHMWGYWQPDPDSNGDHRFNWAIAGDPIGMGMRNLVRDVNNVRWNHPALRTDTLSVSHRDDRNQVLAFRRWTSSGDIVLVVVNLGDGQWENGDYGVGMGGENGIWEEIFNSQSPQYGGWNGSGNFGARPRVQGDGRLYINLPKWSVLMFRKQ